jgi:hypothetical protein
MTAAWATAADQSATSGSGGLLPFEVGLGGLVAVAAAFWLGRMCRPAHRVSPVLPLAPTNPIRPVNLIRRLDELEHLTHLGVLTPEEFEIEKDKLRKLI